jgi:DNA-binding transcriptional LysR family regulator
MHARLVRYFLALVQERHFARAADACGVSQPTLSAAIRSLERQIGKQLIIRDRRFVDLTPEGEAILPWARQLVAAQEEMVNIARATPGTLSGEVRLGAIPAALPWTGRVGAAILAMQPGLSLGVRSMTSREIVRGLGAFELDGGLTYLDHEPPANVLSIPLYEERYMVLVHRGAIAGDRERIAIAEAAALPLCLLHQGMQNRRILDALMAAHGLALHPKATADSYVALLAMVQTGAYATIVPDSYAMLFPQLDWAVMLPFSEAVPASRIGLVVPDRSPASPLTGALMKAAQSVSVIENLYQS